MPSLTIVVYPSSFLSSLASDMVVKIVQPITDDADPVSIDSKRNALFELTAAPILRNLSLHESGIGRQEAAMPITGRIIARQYRPPKSFVRLFYKGPTPKQKDDLAVCSPDRTSEISRERTSSKL